MKERITEYILGLGVDDVGFAKVEDYDSPKSYPLTRFLPNAKTIISLVFQELDTCESPSSTVAMNGRLDLLYFQRSCSYQINRFLAREFKAQSVNMPYASPIEQHKDRLGIADFSQRHAAIAAGMGTLGRHNLVIHPRFGSRVGLIAIVTDLEIEPTPKITTDLCIHCDLCVKNCPAKALEVPNATNVAQCVQNAQPYGVRSNIVFWQNFVDSTPEVQKQMFADEKYLRMKQAEAIGMQYYCFNCLKSCPIGQR